MGGRIVAAYVETRVDAESRGSPRMLLAGGFGLACAAAVVVVVGLSHTPPWIFPLAGGPAVVTWLRALHHTRHRLRAAGIHRPLERVLSSAYDRATAKFVQQGGENALGFYDEDLLLDGWKHQDLARKIAEVRAALDEYDLAAIGEAIGDREN